MPQKYLKYDKMDHQKIHDLMTLRGFRFINEYVDFEIPQ